MSEIEQDYIRREEPPPEAVSFVCSACSRVLPVEPRHGHVRCACGRGWWLHWALVGAVAEDTPAVPRST